LKSFIHCKWLYVVNGNGKKKDYKCTRIWKQHYIEKIKNMSNVDVEIKSGEK